MGVPSSRKRKRAKGGSVSNLNIGESSSRVDKKHNVSVLSIVGMGGNGKTTLAQLVCNDKTVKSYFDLIMWVCVSDNYDLVRVTKEIIESATKKECNLTNLNELQNDLQKRLNYKKFLLVLDDVWSKDWQDVLAPMKEASEGSVVLVTTRSPECVEISGRSIGSRGVINLKGLDEQFYWDFFKSCAFDPADESNNINQELEDIGKKICERLKGSPLAAKTIGGLLRTNLNVGHWMCIKDSKMWEFQTEEHHILPVLQLSYQYLPTYLKKCFSFCSLYPKDFKFTQSELTEFWIMQGFIGPLDSGKELRTLATVYFADLARRAFFQRHGDKDNSYVIHDLMHDMCLSITKDECFCLENGQSEQKVSMEEIALSKNEQSEQNIRHVSVFQEKKLEVRKELCKYKKLLSLKVGPNSCSALGIKRWCNVLTNIRSLSLARCKINHLPENIGNLKHLQFLDISGSHIYDLPESIWTLYNLQYLNMMDCTKIDPFPEGFNNLVNLERFENIFKAFQYNYLGVRSGSSKKIVILKNLRKLHGSLRITGLDLTSNEDAQKAQLNNKPFINRLELNFPWIASVDDDGGSNKKVLDGLCPHRNLKELKISGYKSTNLSPWLKEEFLPNLTEVEIKYCWNVSTISHLPCFITKLVVSNCPHLVSIPVEVTSNLKSLSKLHLERCDSLLSVGGLQFLATLQEVMIRVCPLLAETKGQNINGKLPSALLKDIKRTRRARK